jgi:hypothetical protein
MRPNRSEKAAPASEESPDEGRDHSRSNTRQSRNLGRHQSAILQTIWRVGSPEGWTWWNGNLRNWEMTPVAVRSSSLENITPEAVAAARASLVIDTD